MLSYRDNSVLNAFCRIWMCLCLQVCTFDGNEEKDITGKIWGCEGWLLCSTQSIMIITTSPTMLFMARITVPKALCKHATKRWFLCKRAYIYQMSGDSNWWQRGRDNKEWILGKRTADCQSCLHPHNILSLIFLAWEVMCSAKPYKSFKTCSTFTVSLLGAEETYWQGLK